MGEALQLRYEKWINETEIEHERQRAIRNANHSANSMAHLNRIDILKFYILLYLFEGGVIRFNDMHKEPERLLVDLEFNLIVDDMLWEKW
jgi:hypothetical protein